MESDGEQTPGHIEIIFTKIVKEPIEIILGATDPDIIKENDPKKQPTIEEAPLNIVFL